MNAYTISKLAKDAGISIHRVRQYEQRGLLRPRERSDSGYHINDEHALTRLQFVVAGRDAGPSLEELATFAQVFDTGNHASTQRALAILKKQVQGRLERIARLQTASPPPARGIVPPSKRTPGGTKYCANHGFL